MNINIIFSYFYLIFLLTEEYPVILHYLIQFLKIQLVNLFSFKYYLFNLIAIIYLYTYNQWRQRLRLCIEECIHTKIINKNTNEWNNIANQVFGIKYQNINVIC